MYWDTPKLGRLFLLERPTTAITRAVPNSSRMDPISDTLPHRNALQPLHFRCGQVTHFSVPQTPQFQEADLGALQFLHQPAEVPDHDAHLILPSLDQAHLVPRIHGALDEPQARRRGFSAMQRDALP